MCPEAIDARSIEGMIDLHLTGHSNKEIAESKVWSYELFKESSNVIVREEVYIYRERGKKYIPVIFFTLTIIYTENILYLYTFQYDIKWILEFTKCQRTNYATYPWRWVITMMPETGIYYFKKNGDRKPERR